MVDDDKGQQQSTGLFSRGKIFLQGLLNDNLPRLPYGHNSAINEINLQSPEILKILNSIKAPPKILGKSDETGALRFGNGLNFKIKGSYEPSPPSNSSSKNIIFQILPDNLESAKKTKGAGLNAGDRFILLLLAGCSIKEAEKEMYLTSALPDKSESTPKKLCVWATLGKDGNLALSEPRQQGGRQEFSLAFWQGGENYLNNFSSLPAESVNFRAIGKIVIGLSLDIETMLVLATSLLAKPANLISKLQEKLAEPSKRPNSQDTPRKPNLLMAALSSSANLVLGVAGAAIQVPLLLVKAIVNPTLEVLNFSVASVISQSIDPKGEERVKSCLTHSWDSIKDFGEKCKKSAINVIKPLQDYQALSKERLNETKQHNTAQAPANNQVAQPTMSSQEVVQCATPQQARVEEAPTRTDWVDKEAQKKANSTQQR